MIIITKFKIVKYNIVIIVFLNHFVEFVIRVIYLMDIIVLKIVIKIKNYSN